MLPFNLTLEVAKDAPQRRGPLPHRLVPLCSIIEGNALLLGCKSGKLQQVRLRTNSKVAVICNVSLWMEHSSSPFCFLILRWLEINSFSFFFPKDYCISIHVVHNLNFCHLGTTLKCSTWVCGLMIEPSKASTTTKIGGNLIAASEWFLPAPLLFHTSHQPRLSFLRAPFDLVKVEERMTTFCEALSSQAKGIWVIREMLQKSSDVFFSSNFCVKVKRCKGNLYDLYSHRWCHSTVMYFDILVDMVYYLYFSKIDTIYK